MILRIFLGGLLAVSVVRAQSPSPDNQDQAALIALENEWLANLHNPAVLEKILASDFVHPLPTGDFVTKAQHIQFSSTHLPPPNRRQRFDQMQVRVYGDVGVVNGIVLTTDEQGREVERTISPTFSSGVMDAGRRSMRRRMRSVIAKRQAEAKRRTEKGKQ